MTEYKRFSDAVVLSREQGDWALEALFSKHAELLGAGELRRLATDLDYAIRGLSGCHWWDHEAREFLLRGPFVGRTMDNSYYFFVDDQLLQIIDIGGWLGPPKLSFRKYPAELEERRGEFQARLAAVLKKAGLAWPMNDQLWTELKPEDQEGCEPQFVADDQWTVDDL